MRGKGNKKRRFTDKLYFLLVFLLVSGGVVVVASYLGKELIKASEIPIVYMVHGDKDVCAKATDAQGESISCAEAMKGSYHTEWIAPKTLH